MPFTIEHHGTIALLRPNSEEARLWLVSTAPEDSQFLGEALAVEPRYIDNVLTAYENDHA